MRRIGIVIAVLLLLLAMPSFSCQSGNKNKSQYHIRCEFDGTDKLFGTGKVNFYNDSENAFTELKFNLYANAYREGAKYSPVSVEHLSKSYPNGINYGNIEIKSVKTKQIELEYSIKGEDKNVLAVILDREVFPNESIEIIIDYEVNIANVISRTGINDKTINLANFYPILCAIENGSFYECLYYSTGDPYFSECADYTVEFTYPSEYIVAQSGKVIKSKENGAKTTAEYKIENARSFAMVLSKEFQILTKTYGETEINYYYYDDVEANNSLNTAIDAIATFSNLFGKYPYKTYSVVQTKFIEGGMEFPALVYISDAVKSESYLEVIVHETAHQWWQTVVGNNEIEHAFLDEGLTEYSVLLFYETNPKYGLKREELVKISQDTFKIFCSVYDKLYNKVDTSMVRPLSKFSSEYEYVNIAYIKSVIMFDTLRKTIGDKKFFSALENYYKKYSYSVANPYSLVNEFEGVGAKVSGYFSTFFQGKEII